MCLIIFAPKIHRARINKGVLESAFNSNKDGAGIAYLDEDSVRISKAFFAWEDFYAEYQRIRSTVHKGGLLIHFRNGTGGSNNHTNTQPIAIYKHKLVMAHNGVIHSMKASNEDISDSVVLSRLIKNLKWTFPFKKPESELLNRLCGDNSKLVFLNDKGKYSIYNENLGKWFHGSWYSNPKFVTKEDNSKLHISNHKTIATFRDQTYGGYDDDNEDKFHQHATTYAQMTREQRLEYDKTQEFRKRQREYVTPQLTSVAQFRRHSVIGPNIPIKKNRPNGGFLFDKNTDPDTLTGEEFQDYQEWLANEKNKVL